MCGIIFRNILVLMVLLLGYRPALQAKEAFNLEDGQNAFYYGDYKKTIAIVKPLLYPQVKLTNEKEAIKAYNLLAVSYYCLKQPFEAKVEFLHILLLNPEYELDPVSTQPEIIKYFNGIKAEFKKKVESSLKKGQKTPQKVKIKEVIVTKTVQKKLIWINLIPFGMGQFQNNQIGKGIAFLTLELIFLATNLTFYYLTESLRMDSGYFSKSDIDTARKFQIVQILSLGVFLTTVGWGIFDAFINYKKTEVKVEPKKKEPPKKKTGFMLNPGIGGEFSFGVKGEF